MEVWKEKILDFDNTGLFVSNRGNIKNGEGRILSIGDNGAGYKKATIHNRDSKKSKNFYIHRLVAELFIGETCDVKT